MSLFDRADAAEAVPVMQRGSAPACGRRPEHKHLTDSDSVWSWGFSGGDALGADSISGDFGGGDGGGND